MFWSMKFPRNNAVKAISLFFVETRIFPEWKYTEAIHNERFDTFGKLIAKYIEIFVDKHFWY